MTDEERRILEKTKQFVKQMEDIPDSEKTPITNPKKYSFPVGVLKDENGEYYLNTLENAHRKRAENQD